MQSSMQAEMRMSQHAGDTRQTIVIGIIGFLTLVDLFAAQAILPTLVNTYHVTPGAMGLAVNASTLGMAIAGLVVSLISGGINRRRGIYLCLAVLAIPTTLLAFAPSLTVFAILRIVQGVFMATAFTLTMAYLAEECTASGAAAALAAYVTGGVASNLVGRLVAGFVANHFGLAINFYTFAVLNLVGAALVYFSLKSTMPMHGEHGMRRSPFAAWAAHIKDRSLRACFGMGFLILFAFIGTFTYVNFVLSRAPLSLSPMSLGLVYFVFLPSMFTTPLAGRIASRFGSRLSFWVSLCVAAVGLPLILLPNLAGVLTGLVLVGVGTFFAQATATGFVGRAAHTDRVAASGLYLASYYFGGLAGAALLGQVFDHFGWGACVAGIGISLALAALLAIRLEMRAMTPAAAEMPAPMKANSKFTERKLGRS